MRDSSDPAAAGRDIATIRALLAPANPVPDTAPTEVERQHGERVLRTLLATLDQPSGRAARGGLFAPRRTYPRPRALVTAAGLVLAIAALLVGGTVLRTGDSATAAPLLPAPLLTATAGDHAAAVRALTRAAELQRGLSPAGVGPVLYARSQTYGLDVTVAQHKSTTVARTTIIDFWQRPDGSKRIRKYLQNIDRAGGNVGGPAPMEDRINRMGQGEFPLGPPDHDPSKSPTDATQLRTLLSSRNAAAGHPGDLGIVLDVISLLSSGLTSPQQNAAIYDVLAQIPTVFDAGAIRDRAGRPGHAIGVVASDHTSLVVGTQYVIFSDTGAPLTIEMVDTPNAPPGLHLPPGPTIARYTQIITASRVHTVGDTH
ncbi:hypothetical protein FDG2_1576 [Candidatus Protofrankia californiensis]|uniref:Uncharacterized protein n=1 Tax=Candidatus Protofrankia californiensis TaxID=1839754 RepID=A0A1C3NW06_9ACTN|nr:hypothetical protein FDG2_1576 [Candidatus Protofrankia californiensis]